MKKLLVSLVAAALMALGLVGMSSSPAQAACPIYTGCIKTVTSKISGPTKIERRGSPTYVIGVQPKAGSGTVRGHVVLRCMREGFRNKVNSGELAGGQTTIDMPKFRKKGVWDCTAQYIRHRRFLGSHTSWTLRVG